MTLVSLSGGLKSTGASFAEFISPSIVVGSFPNSFWQKKGPDGGKDGSDRLTAVL